MGVATIDGIPFRIDPDTVSWDHQIKKSVQETIGGKVIQILGVKLGAMTVSGSFGQGYFQEQRAWLSKMRALADSQVNDFTAMPPRFLYPGYGWDFLVYLTSYSTKESAQSIVLDMNTVNVTWKLIFHIVEDNSGLSQVLRNAYIDRLADGIGWRPNKYNGPEGFNDLQTTLSEIGATDLRDYLIQAYGLDRGAEGGSPTGTPGGLTGADGIAQAFNFFVSSGLQDFQSAGLVGNLQAESGVDPTIIQGGGHMTSPRDPGGVGRGIAQWSFDGRWQTYLTWAEGQNKEPLELLPQLQYVWQELTTSYSGVLSALRASTSVQQASDIVLHDYEVAADRNPGGSNSIHRAQLAQTILDTYGGYVGAQAAATT